MSESQWVTNGQYDISHPGGVGVSKRYGLQVCQCYLQYRKISGRIGADDHGIGGATIVEHHLDSVSLCDDVVVGQYMALFSHNDARAERAFDALTLRSRLT